MNVLCLMVLLGCIRCGMTDDTNSQIETLKNRMDALKKKNDVYDWAVDHLNEKLDELLKKKQDRRKYMDQLEKVRLYIERVEKYITMENEGDVYLQTLPTSLLGELEEDMNDVADQISKMKSHVSLTLGPQEVSLKEVDKSAKSRNVVVAGVLYYGEVGSACSGRNDVCKLTDTECRAGRCQCRPGLSFDSLHKTCVRDCDRYGSNFQTVPKYIIRGHNDQVRNETSLLECKQQCVKEDAFTCKSFDWFPRWRTCYMSSQARYDVDESAWEYNSASVHFQRDCIVN